MEIQRSFKKLEIIVHHYLRLYWTFKVLDNGSVADFRTMLNPSMMCWLRGWTFRGSNPVGARFFAQVQNNPRAHHAFCTMDTGSFLGVKQPGRGANHPLPSSAEVKEE
jgi:hypothetical protein